MNDVLEKYYQGITQQIRAEVDFINSLFKHQGLKGEGNETILRDLLVRFIPKRFAIGSGVVIDRQGIPSRQCDIIIYDSFLYPSLLSLTSVHLFPVDIVYAVIEVKTTLTSTTASEALRNISSVRNLDIVPDKFMLLESRTATKEFPEGPHLAGVEFEATPPMGIVFAYNSDARQIETFKEWFTPKDPARAFEYPTMVGCLDQGIIKFQYLSPKVGMLPETFALPVMLNEIEPVKIPSSAKSEVYNGREFPVKSIKGEYLLIDQSRALLLFLLLFNEFLAQKAINPSISFTQNYLPSSLRVNVSV